MALRVSSQNVKISGALRAHIKTRIEDVAGKCFDGTYDGHVTIEKDGRSFKTECVLHLSSGATIHAMASLDTLYGSCDAVVSRIERRLQKYKGKLKHYHWPTNVKESTSAYRVLEAPSTSEEDKEVADDYTPVIIAEASCALKELTVADAVIELDLSDKTCLLFNNAKHGGLNVVYRRQDGAIGWIDPQSC